MATRKAALVGAPEGPWILTRDMAEPHADVRLGDGVVLEVQYGDGAEALRVDRSGMYPLTRADWTRLVVVAGNAATALVTLVSRGAPCPGIR